MISVRKAAERGYAKYDWLDTWHTFSFDDYYDPAHMRFRSLRVLNEDRLRPGHGFPRHGHRDMEIVTYVLDGTLEHQDSVGNGGLLLPGDVQRITAGTGIEHREFNSGSDPVHHYQIWIYPDQRGLIPEYEQKSFSETRRAGRLCLVASPDGEDDSLTIHQQVRLFVSSLATKQTVTYALLPERYAWLQVVRGQAKLNGTPLEAGDGAAISKEPQLEVAAAEPTEILLIDLA